MQQDKAANAETNEVIAQPNRAFKSEEERILYERNKLLSMLDHLCSTLNTCGELAVGGSDADTDVGSAYREASALVKQLRDY